MQFKLIVTLYRVAMITDLKVQLCIPSVAPGYKIIQNPVNIVYLPLNREHMFNIRIWITDQNENIMDFRGEVQTLRLHLSRKQQIYFN